MDLLNSKMPEVPETELRTLLSADAGRPLVLFPVRLETRFFRQGGANELRVRVYPDRVHINTHEPKLTAEELTWGKHFWEQMWPAMNDEEAKKLAWRQLADRFDARRAAWVARALRPLNLDDRLRTAGATAPLPIVFPTPDTKSVNDDWTRAPLAGALPDRWHVRGYKNGELTAQGTGKPIRPGLATGPDPSAPPLAGSSKTSPRPSDEQLAIDVGMKWMVDFDEAEKAGMGIRVQLKDDVAQQGFDFLLVMGTQFTPGKGNVDGSQALVELFEAHHYTDGLSFVLNGTPSNNTKDAPSGFSTVDLGHAESYQAEFGDDDKPGERSNAAVLAKALGLRNGNNQLFDNLTNATATEQLDARHMNRALWPATLGYFLTQMMAANSPHGLTAAHIKWAKEHFVEYVRASGPLPTLRIDRQPYGILPVTSLRHWRSDPPQQKEITHDSDLKELLLKLRGQWRNNLSQVPRVGRSGNPDQDFADTLSMDGISSRYGIRHLFGSEYLMDLWSLIAPGLARGSAGAAWLSKLQEMAKASWNSLDLSWHPWLAQAAYSGWLTELTGPIAQADTASESIKLSPDYIKLLLNAPSIDDVHNEVFSEPKPKSLLYALLRHAMLWEYTAAAWNLLNPDKKFPARGNTTESAFFTVKGATTTRSMLSQTVKDVPLGTFLHGLRVGPKGTKVSPDVKSLLEFRESLTWLQELGAARLERLCAGTLDTCAHRLDAWVTSLATKRLDQIRESKPTGLLIGGYGWVLNLTPAKPQIREATLPAGEPAGLFGIPDNPGYTHTPSLGQAATVAVMRSGHLTHSDAVRDLLAIDLSSERVRLASWLLEGVRQGQPLGALLGYRFERRLRDTRGLAQFIQHFREVAPLVANKLPQTADKTVAAESIAANNVVDGLALQRLWHASPRSESALISLLSQSRKLDDPLKIKPVSAALIAELNLLDDAVDALSDTLLAESVHQAVQGNTLRTASTLDTVAGGAPPPELEVVRTPRTGIALTYRLVALFDTAPAKLGGEWLEPAQPYRANAEPLLNAWVARLLGNPNKVRCLVERYDPATGATLETKERRLSELPLTPLDLIYAAQGARNAQLPDVEQRLCYTLMRQPNGFAVDSALRVNPQRGADWQDDDLSYGDLVELVRTARGLIAGARPLDANDLSLPGRTQPSAVDLAELNARANNAEEALLQINDDLQMWLDANTAPDDLDTLRGLLVRASGFGVPGAVPLSAAGSANENRDVLLLQASAAAKEVAKRAEELRTLKSRFTNATAAPDEVRAFLINCLQAAFGKGFLVLPRFTAGNALELNQALAASLKIQDGDPLATVTWFQRAVRVREGVARLDATLRYAEALAAPERLNLTVAQLPFRDDVNERWVGLPLQPNVELSPSRFSIVVQSTAALDLSLPLTGLLIDEWIEAVPNASETTGVVFQYDQPDASPPQCILLAVSPDLEQPWSLLSLQQVLLETLDLARLRAIDPETLDDVGHYLPALYFAINRAGDTVSTDLANLK